METPQFKICTQCHLSKPLDAFGKNHTLKSGKMSACRACMKKRNKANYAKNKERWAPVFAANRAANREKNCVYAHNYRKENKDKTPISYIRRIVIKQRYRARKLALPDTFTTAQWQFSLTYWQNCCVVCQRPDSFWSTLAADHWIPIASLQCPGTVATNMLPLCHGEQGCNNSKGDSDPHKWLVHRYGTRKAAKIEKAIAAYCLEVTRTFPSSEGELVVANALSQKGVSP